MSHVVPPPATSARRRTRAALLVALVFALRAFVPMGYMLSLPGGNAAGIALELCPLQNAALDLSLLGRAGHPAGHGHHHGHHGEDTGDNPGDPSLAAFSDACTAWTAGNSPAPVATLSLVLADGAAAAAPWLPAPRPHARTAPGSVRARAPPPAQQTA
ncbi:MAG: hypothetical protein ACU85V_20145 [Gammaproteobacteria bacterium]